MNSVIEFEFATYDLSVWCRKSGLAALKNDVWLAAFAWFDSRVDTATAIEKANDCENTARLQWLEYHA